MRSVGPVPAALSQRRLSLLAAFVIALSAAAVYFGAAWTTAAFAIGPQIKRPFKGDIDASGIFYGGAYTGVAIISLIMGTALLILGAALYIRRRRFSDVAQKLREAEEGQRRADAAARQLSAIINSSDDAIIGKTLDGTVTSWNSGAAKIYGFTAGEIVGKPISKLVVSGQEDEFPHMLEEIRHGRHIENYETVRRRKDGTVIHVALTVSPILDSNGEVIGASTTARDITLRKRGEEALRLSEERYRSLFKHSALPLFEEDLSDAKKFLEELRGDAAGDWAGYFDKHQEILKKCASLIRIRDANEEGVRMFPVEKKPETLDHVLSHFVEDTWNGFKGLLVAVAEGKTQYACESRILNAVGEYRDVIIRASIPPESRGNLERVLISFVDITEQKQREALDSSRLHLAHYSMTHSLDELLEETLNETEKLTGSLIGFFHFVDPDQESLTLQNWSTRTKKVFCKADAKGQHYPISAAGVWVDCVRERAAVIHNDYDSIPHKRGMPEGHARVTRELVVPIIRGGIIKGILGVGNKPVNYNQQDVDIVTKLSDLAWDIVDRKESERALLESEEKFRALVEGSESAIWIHDGRQFLYANPATLRMTGYTADEFKTVNVRDMIDTEHRETLSNLIERRLAGDDVPSHLEFRICDKEGKGVWIDFSGTLINYLGRPAILVSAYNITEKKKLEEQLAQSQKMEGIGRLAGGIAHDYNNMLGVVMGYTQLLMKNPEEGSTLRRYIGLIDSAARRAADLTKQLMAFARREVASPKALSPNDAITALCDMISKLNGEDITLRFVPGENMWNIRIDPTQFDQIILNLSTNSRDAIKGVGNITIETSKAKLSESLDARLSDLPPGDYVVIDFSDDGCGIPKNSLDKIFEPFFTTKPRGKGTGLGLSTVYGIVKQNGGTINVYSEEGKGATFRIYLPRYAGEVERHEGVVEAADVRGGETILVVEDQPELLELAKTSLEEFGYVVLAASTPAEGIAIGDYEKDKISLLLTDVIMPELSGKDVSDRIHSFNPRIKTLFMSGYTADIIANRGILEAGVEFIQKPFTPTSLARKVRQVLDA